MLARKFIDQWINNHQVGIGILCKNILNNRNKIKFTVVNFRKGFFEKDIQAVIFNRPDIQKIVGVFSQLVIGKIDI
jgi:hypothetical protein